MLIGLGGHKGVGKDTVGKILVEEHGFERLAFADKVKEAAAALLDVPDYTWDVHKNEQHSVIELNLNGIATRRTFTVRHFLQRVGTEMGREVFGKDFWLDLLLPISPIGESVHLYGHRKIVVTDVRFPNEYERIRKLGGYNVHIMRPSLPTDDVHISESRPDPKLIDHYIHNTQTLEVLSERVKDLLYMISDGSDTRAAR